MSEGICLAVPCYIESACVDQPPSMRHPPHLSPIFPALRLPWLVLPRPLFTSHSATQYSRYFVSALYTVFNQTPAFFASFPHSLTTRRRSNWACHRCVAGHKGLNGLGSPAKVRHYHDNSPLLSSRVSPSSSSASPSLGESTSLSLNFARNPTPRLNLEVPSMASSVAAPLANPGQHNGGSAGLVINCSFTGCLAKIDGKRQFMCDAHMQLLSEPSRTWEAGRAPAPANATANAAANANANTNANGTHATPAVHPNPGALNPRKLLIPEIDKDRPIMRRKTAGNLPQFVPQQPTPKHSAPSSRGESIKSPPSVRPLAPRPPVRSPPGSPGPSPGFFQSGEPARKRQRCSPFPGHFSRPVANGATSRPPTTDPEKAAESASPQSIRRVLNPSPQRPGKVGEKESKPFSRLNFRHPVRRMPFQLSNLRFIDSPEDLNQGIVSEQSSPGVNGSAGPLPRRTSAGSISSLNGPITEYWANKTSTPVESPTQTWKQPAPQNGPSQKILPERRKTAAQTPSRPIQRNGTASSKPPWTYLAIKPAQITKPQYPPPRPVKQVDVARFDALIYAQQDASSPPPDVSLAALPKDAPPPPPKAADTEKQQPKDEPLYLPIDPRVHWPQPHSAEWHAAKQEEIQARGKKKANFGRATQSLRRQRQQEDLSEEAGLPDKIVENPAWMRALRRLKACEKEGAHHGDGSSVEGGTGRGKKQNAITGKRVGNTGLVVVSGLTESQLGGLGRRDS